MSDHSIFSSTIPNGQDHSIEVGDSETGIDLSGYFSLKELEGDTRDYDVRLRADANAYAADDGVDQADASLARYRMSRGGLFYYPASKKNVEDDETAKPIWLSPPFDVVARTRDPDGNWGKLLRWNDHDGVEVKWVMPARLLGGHRDELWQALYERGLEISSANAARNLLLAYLTRVNPDGRANVVSRLGWYTEGGANVFVLPDAVYGDTGGLEIIYSEMRRAPRMTSRARLKNGANISVVPAPGIPGSPSRCQWRLRRRYCMSSARKVAGSISGVAAGQAKRRRSDSRAALGAAVIASTDS